MSEIPTPSPDNKPATTPPRPTIVPEEDLISRAYEDMEMEKRIASLNLSFLPEPLVRSTEQSLADEKVASYAQDLQNLFIGLAQLNKNKETFPGKAADIAYKAHKDFIRDKLRSEPISELAKKISKKQALSLERIANRHGISLFTDSREF